MSNSIFIIANPRSGTSCLAGILHHLNIRMTLNIFRPTDEFNSAGYFEDAEIIKTLCVDYPMYEPNMSFQKLYIYKKECVLGNEKLSNLIKERCDANINWGSKIFLFNYISPSVLLQASTLSVKIINISRPIEDSIRSANISHNGQIPMNFINENNNKFFSKYNGDLLKLKYYSILENPELEIEKIARFCEVNVTNESINFVNKNMRHI